MLEQSVSILQKYLLDNITINSIKFINVTIYIFIRNMLSLIMSQVKRVSLDT